MILKLWTKITIYLVKNLMDRRKMAICYPLIVKIMKMLLLAKMMIKGKKRNRPELPIFQEILWILLKVELILLRRIIFLIKKLTLITLRIKECRFLLGNLEPLIVRRNLSKLVLLMKFQSFLSKISKIAILFKKSKKIFCWKIRPLLSKILLKISLISNNQ